MRRVLFQWRGIKVYAYPALLGVGIVVGVVAGNYAAADHGLDPARTFAAMLLLVVPALVGSRLLYVAVNWRILSRADRRVWRPAGGGAALYGGLVLAFLVSLPLLGALALPIGAFWDAATITLLTGMIFTRFGCLLNGCCAGRHVHGPVALYLPNLQGVWRRRFPSQLFEAALAAALLLASLTVWNRLPFEGVIFLVNLTIYGISRWALEWMRETSNRVADGAVYRAISLSLAVMSLGTLLLMVLSAAGTAWLQPPVAAAKSLTKMSEWYFLLAPVAVLAVLLLFGFVGCGLNVMGLADIHYGIDYVTAVTNDHPAAWWRLQETSATTSPSGGTAKDEIAGGPPGIYTSPTTGFPANSTTGSVGAPSPVVLNLGTTPGLLATDASSKAIEVQGGYVRVPQGGGLFQGSFTIELLASVEWDLSQPGLFLAVLACLDSATANKGFVLRAGPDPLAQYSWQLRVGTGTAMVPLTAQPAGPRPGDPGLNVIGNNAAMYLALTYDATASAAAFKGYYYYGDRNMDWLTYVLPFPAGAALAPAAATADLLIGIDRPFQPIAQVQATGTAPANETTAGVPLSYAQTTTSGNLLVVAVALNGGGTNPVTATLSDTYNNTWKQACRAQTTGANPFSAEIWYAENCKGGANHKITVTPNLNAYVAFSSAEYSGVALAGALDQTSTSVAGSAAPSAALSSGNLSTTNAALLYLGAAQWGGVNLAATNEPGWTSVYAHTPTATTAALSVEALGAAAPVGPGTYAASWTLSSPHPWAACLASFLPASPNPFQGKIEEVAIYSQALKAEQIASHGMAAFQN